MNLLKKVRRRYASFKCLMSARRIALQVEKAAANDPKAPIFSIQSDPNNFRRALLRYLDNRIFCPVSLLKARESSQVTQGRRLVRKAMDKTSRPFRFRGKGFILEIPECFPHADDVALNDLAEIYIENHYLAGFPYRPIENGAVVLDCGANIGAFAVYAAGLAADVRVLAFEPEPQTFAALERNVELNQLSGRVACLPFGLSNKDEVKTLLMNPDCFTTHHFADVAGVSGGSAQAASLQIQCVTIDQIIAQHNIARCDFIKMDVEGSEGVVLKGAAETIVRFRPRLSMAAYHTPEDAYVLPMTIREICPDYNIIVSREAHLYAFC